MHIRPEFITIGELFLRNNIFKIPKYQRPYAWGEEEITDFCKDIEASFRKREGDPSRDHFFGGLLCSQSPKPGQSRADNIVVDGQQRLATFVLFASRMIAKYQSIKKRDRKIRDVAARRAMDLQKQYIIFEDRTNMVPKQLPRLTLSRHDDDFFQKLVSQQNPTPMRYSHQLLTEAGKSIDALLDDLTGETRPKEQIVQLVRLENLLNQALSVIHLATDDINDAYRLFQVINDRGLNLTECDLLRAYTLGKLDTPSSQKELQLAEEMWDEIQNEPPNHLQDYLRWHYSEKTGKSAGKTTLYDEVAREFFPRSLGLNQIVEKISLFKDAVALGKQLRDGEWPFPSSFDMWKTIRLRLLVQVLKHNHCMPLLFAAYGLGEKQFTKVMRDLDKFFFRYKVVCRAHASPMSSVYLKHAKLINDDPSRFNTNDFRGDLRDLLIKYGDDQVFTTNLGRLKYEEGCSNKEVRYLLVTLAENWAWFREGCRGGHKKRWHLEDTSRVFDFKNTTIEHVYPQNASVANRDAILEPLKHNLGNLTVLDPGTNQEIGNVSFRVKRKMLRTSSNLMNREISQKRQWRANEVETRQEDLMSAALRIFSV